MADFPVLTREVNDCRWPILTAASAKTESGGGCRSRILPTRLRRRASRYSYAEFAGDPAYGERPHPCGRFSECALAGRAGVCARHLKDQPCRQQLGQCAGPRAGDNIIITEMEHHANIVPWQMLCERVGAALAGNPVESGRHASA